MTRNGMGLQDHCAGSAARNVWSKRQLDSWCRILHKPLWFLFVGLMPVQMVAVTWGTMRRGWDRSSNISCRSRSRRLTIRLLQYMMPLLAPLRSRGYKACTKCHMSQRLRKKRKKNIRTCRLADCAELVRPFPCCCLRLTSDISDLPFMLGLPPPARD